MLSTSFRWALPAQSPAVDATTYQGGAKPVGAVMCGGSSPQQGLADGQCVGLRGRDIKGMAAKPGG